MSNARHSIYIGTSGWSYQHWKINFYPEKMKNEEWLAYYSKQFSSVEINTTFYHLPLLSTTKKWQNTVPDDFLFSIKASRYITHQKRLKECEEALKKFYSRIRPLKNKIGPLLFQLSPSFKIDIETLIHFIKILKKGYQYAFEFRHSSWFVEDVYQILRSENIALCITDLNGFLSPEEITAGFTYIRLHGPKKAYKGSYGTENLLEWKKKISKWNKSINVYCYFDNDEKGFAITDALELKKILSL